MAMRFAITLAIVALSLFTGTIESRAQLTENTRKIGVLMGNGQPEWKAAFEQGLSSLGWVEGKNITIEYLSAEGYFDRLPGLCADLIRQGVDVILAVSAPETAAAKKCTSTIPIVFAIHGDPVGTGDVESLSHPGGNATGMSQTQGDLVPKLIGLLNEVVPHLSRLAILWNSSVKSKAHDWQEATATAPKLGITLESYKVVAPGDLNGALAAIAKNRPDALLVFGDPLVVRLRGAITDFAAKERLPAIYPQRQFVDAGGLMSYSADLVDLFRRSAWIVDKVLKGAKPKDIPVEQPTKFEFIINLKVARALNLAIPPDLFARADQVID
jgi:putative tryptophan/tyrosine transport system substrate-binding protein